MAKTTAEVEKAAGATTLPPGNVEFFGENVFNAKTMQRYLSPAVCDSLQSTIRLGETLDPAIADEVAEAMKNWAVGKGATHFTHWFQPLTGATAEKHESFVTPDCEGGAIYRFSGKELTRGEPDASSFPSGGLRATFEARGYTAWDPTSPAFVKQGGNGGVLCIPTVFCCYHGESLDKKTPLLRSIQALSRQAERLGRLFGEKSDGGRPYVSLGAEQEYFLIDKRFFANRLDLLQTGRTLFGRAPAKHQQMEDHYFGVVKSRVLEFMNDLDAELWRLGVPSRTRHNEVCPGQFEIVPTHESLNLAVDHNMLVMDLLRETAERHGFACLLHEKPFADVNGSGKHNNWSLHGPDGSNWLVPGANPRENARFLTVICAFIKAVDTHAELIRASVASAGNDLRLGANEAPPAIVSVFLGDHLTDVLVSLEKGVGTEPKASGWLEIGVSCLPRLPKDATDRNRTSPLAFTGNKFEFRAVGASQSCADANVVLNTIMAEALNDICGQLEKDVASGGNFNETLQAILRKLVSAHKRVLFNGDSYSEEWKKEAAKRGLANIARAPQALEALISRATIALFEKYGVLSEKELRSRYEVYSMVYAKTVAIEARCAAHIVRTKVLPAAVTYQKELGAAINLAAATEAGDTRMLRRLLQEITRGIENILSNLDALEAAAQDGPRVNAGAIESLAALRALVDGMERVLPANIWPLASYAEMLFMT